MITALQTPPMPDREDPDPVSAAPPRHRAFGDEFLTLWGRPLADRDALARLGSLRLIRMSEGGYYYDHPGADVRGAILNSAQRRHRSSIRTFPEWAEIEDFMLDVVTAAAPQTKYTATHLITAVGAFVSWAYSVKRYPLKPELLFRRETIELYIKARQSEGGLADGGLRNYRSQLLRVSEFVLPDEHPYKVAALNRRTSVAPYNQDDDAAALRRWVNQPTAIRTQRASAIVCLAMGAGLTAREIITVSTDDVTNDERGIVIHIREGRVRDVPLLVEWETLLRRLLERVQPGARLFAPSGVTNAKNTISSFSANSSSADFRPRADRMRASWIVWHLTNRTQMRALMTAAGISKMENLLRYLEFVPELDTEEYRAELRGQVQE